MLITDSFIRLDDWADEGRDRHLLLALTHELCRLILREPRASYRPEGRQSGRLADPVRLLISRDMRDESLVPWIRRHIDRHFQLDTFFEVVDVAAWGGC